MPAGAFGQLTLEVIEAGVERKCVHGLLQVPALGAPEFPVTEPEGGARAIMQRQAADTQRREQAQ